MASVRFELSGGDTTGRNGLSHSGTGRIDRQLETVQTFPQVSAMTTATDDKQSETTTSVEVAIATAQPRNSGRHRLKFYHYDGDPNNFYASVTVCLIFGATIESATLSSSEILDAIAAEQDRKVREYVESLIEESEHSDAHIEKIDCVGEPHFQFASMGAGKTYISWNYLFTAYVTTYEHLKSAA